MTDLPAAASFKEQLSGPQAFYEQPDYRQRTADDFGQTRALPPVYRHDTQKRSWRLFKDALALVLLPVGLGRLLHRLSGMIFVPASVPKALGLSKDHADAARRALVNRTILTIDDDGNRSSKLLIDVWKMKRLTIQCDGYTIDACIMGKADTLGNGRWLLASNGNGEFYEDKLAAFEFRHLLARLESNAIVFNYPGVGASHGATGLPSRSALRKAYQAVLAFLEDQQTGIGAQEIIGYGHSIGGVTQGEGLKHWQPQPDIKYCFVKSRTLATMSKTAGSLAGAAGRAATRLLGWNMSSRSSSRRLAVPEIVMQTAAVDEAQDISGRSDLVVDDGIISPQAALLPSLDRDAACPKERKYLMGIPEKHNEPLSHDTIDHLCDKVAELLSA